jgi:hypothetical protein
LDQREMKWQEVGENCKTRSCIICTLQRILVGSNQGGWDGRGMQRVWGRREMHSKI